MGRYFSVQAAAAATSTNSIDLFELTATADKPIRIWGWHVFQTSDLGDSAEEVLAITLERGVTAGSGGTAVTPAAMDANGGTAWTSCNRQVSTVHTSGTVLLRRGWNIRVPEEFWYTPETAPLITSATDPVTLTLGAPTDAITVGGSLIFEEL